MLKVSWTGCRREAGEGNPEHTRGGGGGRSGFQRSPNVQLWFEIGTCFDNRLGSL